MKVKCVMEFNERTSTVEIRHHRTSAILMLVKLEKANIGTMTRIKLDGSEDCDNFWMGVKPADSVVFEELLFGDSTFLVKEIDYAVSGGNDRARRGLS